METGVPPLSARPGRMIGQVGVILIGGHPR